MPLPKPGTGESEKDFIGRCMSALADEFPDQKQRTAVCYKQYRGDNTEETAYHAQLDDVELFRPGKWNGREYTEDDIDDMLSAASQVGYVPPVKLGHEEKSGAPAYGWVKNLRKVGDRLVATLTDLPQEVYDAIRNKRYNALSSEIFFNLERDGNKFRRALKAVALLGAEIPAVSGLKPLTAFSALDYESIHFAEVLDMDLKELKEENARLAAELDTLKQRKDLTQDVEKLTQSLTEKEKALSEHQAKIARLEDELRNRQINEKVKNLPPAYRESFAAIYGAADLQRVVKFGQEDRSVEQIMDTLGAKLTSDFEKLFKEVGNGKSETKSDEPVDVQIANLATKYERENKVSYREAFHAVLEQNPELAQAYLAN